MLLAPRWFNRILKWTLGAYLSYRYNVTGVNTELLEKVPPPYLLIPNHVNYWDPFLISMFIDRPVYFVAADGNFRSTLMRRLLTLVGAIPKAKAKSDTAAVRNMVELLRRGEVVGVFAEGQRTWDGEGLEPLPATAKLLRFLKTTVVVPHLRGAYLSLPRWSPVRRKGVLEIAFDESRVLSAGQIQSMKLAELDSWLRKAISFSESSWQAERMIPFVSPRQAEYAETLLYACPDCEKLGPLRSSGKRLTCRNCGFQAFFDRYGYLTGPFDTVPAWNSWQKEMLRRSLEVWASNGSGEPYLKQTDLILRTGRGSRPLHRRGIVSIALRRDGLEIIPKGQGADGSRHRAGSQLLAYSEIHGVHVQLRQDLEFYHRQRLYVLTPRNERVSSHLWERLILEAQAICFTG